MEKRKINVEIQKSNTKFELECSDSDFTNNKLSVLITKHLKSVNYNFKSIKSIKMVADGILIPTIIVRIT